MIRARATSDAGLTLLRLYVGVKLIVVLLLITTAPVFVGVAAPDGPIEVSEIGPNGRVYCGVHPPLPGGGVLDPGTGSLSICDPKTVRTLLHVSVAMLMAFWEIDLPFVAEN